MRALARALFQVDFSSGKDYATSGEAEMAASRAWDEAEHFQKVLRKKGIHSELGDERPAVEWDLDLSARAPQTRDFMEVVAETRRELGAAIVTVAYPDNETIGFRTTSSVAHDSFTNPVVRKKLITAVSALHDFVDRLIMQLAAAEQGEQPKPSEIPLRDRN